MGYTEEHQKELNEELRKRNKTVKRVIGSILVVFFLIMAIVLNPIVIVSPGTRGVVIQMGSVKNTILDEGPHLILPIRDSVYPVNVRIVKTDIEGEAGTSDSQKADIKATVNWQIIANPKSVIYVYQELNDDAESRILKPNAIDAIKSAVGKFRAEELIGRRDDARDLMLVNLRKILQNQGIAITGISFTSITFSAAFDKSIEEKTIAEQRKKQAEFDLARIEVEARQDIARANGVAESMKAKRQEITPELIAAQRLDNEKSTIDNQKLAIENQKDFVKKWDGKLPQYSGTGGMPFFMSVPNPPITSK